MRRTSELVESTWKTMKKWIVCSDGYVRQREISSWRVEWDQKYKLEQYFDTKLAAQKKAVKEQEGNLIWAESKVVSLTNGLQNAKWYLERQEKELERRRKRIAIH